MVLNYHLITLQRYEKISKPPNIPKGKFKEKTARFLFFQNNSCTFADSMKKPTTMNIYRNTLGGRRDFMDSPPPLTDINTKASASLRAFPHALLLSAHAVRGRAFLCLQPSSVSYA